MASEAEGFGLPIIEAARYDKPLILRDIPVFREIAGEHAFYFQGMAPEDLGRALSRWLHLETLGKVPLPHGMRLLSWQESAQRLFRALGIKVPAK